MTISVLAGRFSYGRCHKLCNRTIYQLVSRMSELSTVAPTFKGNGEEDPLRFWDSALCFRGYVSFKECK